MIRPTRWAQIQRIASCRAISKLGGQLHRRADADADADVVHRKASQPANDAGAGATALLIHYTSDDGKT